MDLSIVLLWTYHRTVEAMCTGIPIRPFQLSIDESQLVDLRARLDSVRWPNNETVPGWTQGVPVAAQKELHHYWRHRYDWGSCQAWFNSYPQFIAGIDGEEIHFFHIKSKTKNALPMLLIHGWPGSVLEFRKAIEPLIDPEAYGGSKDDSFDLVIPSLPGYGWSAKPKVAGWNHQRISNAFVTLMGALGYDKWVAQGGDWGADIVAIMANNNPPKSLVGVHMNTAFFDAHKEIVNEPTDAGEELALEKQHRFETDENAYFRLQATRPQTIAYSLADSANGQAAWIYEKIYNWTQHTGDLHNVLTMDEVLDNIMVYWLSNSGGSSARLYWEDDDNTALPISIPVGVSVFPGDQSYAPRSWGERYYSSIVHWRDVERGGHFAAWEVPDIFVRETAARAFLESYNQAFATRDAKCLSRTLTPDCKRDFAPPSLVELIPSLAKGLSVAEFEKVEGANIANHDVYVNRIRDMTVDERERKVVIFTNRHAVYKDGREINIPQVNTLWMTEDGMKVKRVLQFLDSLLAKNVMDDVEAKQKAEKHHA
ncbi:hypothetical protein PRZ48_005723 [Zasmidium cellare]|uniref:Epoxide hydrolase N-terminal domain-containing protein n=1 Tax=Zasmidium cellare TaxID=395010 RepID=A0ABR0ENA5_ZASCE|nr:hypothetical protein PRZ48_005723 [Zasmidium cellare]